MLETIGVITLVAIAIGIFFLIATKPTEKEKKDQQVLIQHKVKKDLIKMNEESVIEKYKDFVIKIFEPDEKLPKETIINAIRHRNNCSEYDAEQTFHDIAGVGLIFSWEEGIYEKGFVFNSLSRIYTGFCKLGSQLSKEGFRDVTFLDKNPTIKMITDKFLKDPFKGTFRETVLEFGIISKNEALENRNIKEFSNGVGDTFIYLISTLYLFLPAVTKSPSQELSIYLSKNNLTIDDIPNYFIAKIEAINEDKTTMEYRRIFNNMAKNLLDNRVFIKIFEVDQSLFI